LKLREKYVIIVSKMKGYYMRAKKCLVIKKRKKKDIIDWSKIVVDNTIPLNGEEISEQIYDQTGIKTTRQNVSNALKSGLKKFYLQLKKINPKLTPFQRAALMIEMLYPNYTSSENLSRGGVNAFFNLLPPDIKKRILEDAKNYHNGSRWDRSIFDGMSDHDEADGKTTMDLLDYL
jgi:hypothetical protein